MSQQLNKQITSCHQTVVPDHDNENEKVSSDITGKLSCTKSQILDEGPNIVQSFSNQQLTEKSCKTSNLATESDTTPKDDQLDSIPDEVLAGAMYLGNVLYSAINYAGKTVIEASTKIIKTVEENSILSQFNHHQNKFINDKNTAPAVTLPPWVGCNNEDTLKDECVSLSADRRNFLRSPPAGTDFEFDCGVSYPVAMAIMEQDPRLEKIRYELVPKLVSEENFWRNYFYRVNLIFQAHEVTSAPKDRCILKSCSSTLFSEEDWVRELEDELKDYELDDEQKIQEIVSSIYELVKY